MTEFSNIIGLIGVVLLLIAYLLLQLNKLTTLHYSYPVLNLIGSLMILFSLFYDWNLPAVIIETAWSLISILGIAQIIKKRC